MPVFNYLVLQADSASRRGVLTADSAPEVRRVLADRGFIVLDVRKAGERSGISRWFLSFDAIWGLSFGRRKANHRVVASFASELATLLSVGTPLTEALDLMARARGRDFDVRRSREVALHLRDRIVAGASLAAAMAELPWMFDELCVQLTRVGEAAGSLDVALKRLADFKQRTAQLRGRIGTALLYPCIVLMMSVVVTLFLMSFVVPSILEPLADLGKPLPWPTLVVQGASDLLLGWWWLLAIVGLSIVISLTLGLRTHRGARLRDRWMLAMPLLGTLVSKSIIVRICVVLGTLLRSGMPMVQALEATERTIRNSVFAGAIRQCIEAIRSGRDVGPAVEAVGLFPPLVVQVLAIGQESGQMEEMLDRLATEYDGQVAQAAQRLSVALEPLLILFLASIVLLIALATMLPILQAGDVLN